MAITVTSPDVKSGFIKNAISVDVSACEEIIAAVAGKKIKIRQLMLNAGSAITLTLGAGETAGAVTTPLLGPLNIAENGILNWVFNPPLEVPVNTSLTIDSSGAGNVLVFCQGEIN